MSDDPCTNELQPLLGSLTRSPVYVDSGSNRRESQDQDGSVRIRSQSRSALGCLSPDCSSLGKPRRKSRWDKLDISALLISLVCLATGVVTINTHLPFAAELGYTNQIIVLGLVFGIMNLSLQRILQNLFLHVEARYGKSTLQNYEGILRWSPFATHLGIWWRITLLSLALMPLVLSIMYKRYLGGVAYKRLPPRHRVLCGPNGPPGLYPSLDVASRNPVLILMNSTQPFLAAANDDADFPSDYHKHAHSYGFNTIILSENSAASVDSPVDAHMAELQRSLKPSESILLNTTVRGTVAQNDPEFEARRYDPEYWKMYDKYSRWDAPYAPGGGWGWKFGVQYASMACDDTPFRWNNSVVHIGAWRDSTDPKAATWHQNVLRFDLSRHNCSVSWLITRASIQLVNGSCDKQPLPFMYQYFQNMQVDMAECLPGAVARTLGVFQFANRTASPWYIPTHAVMVASAYESYVSCTLGTVGIQPNGPIMLEYARGNASKDWNQWTNLPYNYTWHLQNWPPLNEIYLSDEQLEMQVAATNPKPSLYFILALQPFLTILAYFMTQALYEVPISRTFGLVSMLAGVNRRTLDRIRGTEFSGELVEPVGLQFNIVKDPTTFNDHDQQSTIEYYIGRSGFHGSVSRGTLYGSACSNEVVS